MTCVAVFGCGNGLFPVNGTVTLDGSPVSGATVMLVAKSGGRTGTGRTAVDGRFAISLPDGSRGMPAGDYGVSVVLLKGTIRKNKEINPEQLRSNEELGAVVEGDSRQVIEYVVPKRYSQPDASGLTASVRGALVDLRLELSSGVSP